MSEAIEFLRTHGYPMRIKEEWKGTHIYGTLYDIQLLSFGDFCATYMFPGGEKIVFLDEIKPEDIVEQ